MFSIFLKIASRNLAGNRVYTLLNLASMATGMAVAVLIGLWVCDELYFDRFHKNYNKIVQVGQRVTINGETNTYPFLPIPLADELRKDYFGDFKEVVLASFPADHILAAGEKNLLKKGIYMEAKAPEMLTLQIRYGRLEGLEAPFSILLSASAAESYFGKVDPMGKILSMDNTHTVTVAGVYEDLPYSSTFADLAFIAPWSLYETSNPWVKAEKDDWEGASYQIFAQIADKAELAAVSAKIQDVILRHSDAKKTLAQPKVVLHPMRDWHLHQAFKTGVFAGGSAKNVRLFAVIGVFVLLLACINFMNLSTARSGKRAKEIGIRKAIGSMRGQLLAQFYTESFLVTGAALVLALLAAQVMLPFFNRLAGKQMSIFWDKPLFWLLSLGFALVTGIVAGSYPALYLSSFQPLKVLKGPFKAGKWAALPRKALVVLQFSVSVVLIIGALVVFRQIEFAQKRPIGYDRKGLLMVQPNSDAIHRHFEAVKSELLQSGSMVEMAESVMTTTRVSGTAGDFEWRGKDPDVSVRFPIPGVSFDYGKTVGWEFTAGRDFSRNFPSDSVSALVLNEAAVKFMGFQTPIGENIRWGGKPYQVIGVIRDMVMESPYAAARPTVFFVEPKYGGVVNLRINPNVDAQTALGTMEGIFRKYNPQAPFEYKFADEEFAKKFEQENRIGKLAGLFAALAIFIACLGLFGLAAFAAAQRTKEIGIRKVLGASVAGITGLLAKDFLKLVALAIVIASPIAYYFMQKWLSDFAYRIDIQWWVFAAAGAAAVLVAFLTVGFQSVRAALANPARSLKSE